MPNQTPPQPHVAPEPEDRDYLLKRADQHRRQGEQCDDASRALHARFQRMYEDRAAALPPGDD
ncbi:hypothetical protein [Sphingomonas sp. SAFR-052]|uniref:hypothetical protein n=1 Tax=Sphingomonas sp. SAFR-052 TaxID=3436867 RepID=UPI003F7E4FA7